MPKTVPNPVDLNARIRTTHTPKLTLMERAYHDLEAHVRANGGRLRALTAAELAHEVPPAPDLNARIVLAAAKTKAEQSRKGRK